MGICKFDLGQVVGTPGAIAMLAKHYTLPVDLLERHESGDWGDVCPEDRKANDDSLMDGSRLLSVYTLEENVRVWIITEAADDCGHRNSTTILLPDEY